VIESSSERHAYPIDPPNPELTSEELLTRVGHGDERAFELIYGRLAGPILGMVRRVLWDRALAEEVAQEALLELWRTAPRYSVEEGSATTWAMTLAHRRAVDRARSAQTGTNREAGVTVEARHSRPWDEATGSAAARDERRQVGRCLSRLTDLQRESVSLAYYRGHTYVEVAEILGAPQGTVKTRMRDGLIRLRDCLGVAV
jgi:RNA polymerase sigma-70 factor (ECF subfamily)